MIDIPNDIYSHSLLLFFVSLAHRSDDMQAEAALLNKICMSSLVAKSIEGQQFIEKLSLSDEEKQIIEEGGYCSSDNIEIKARCTDIMRRGNKDYQKMSREASNAYLTLYKINNIDNDAFVRSLTVRGSENISESFQKEYFETLRANKLSAHSLNFIIKYFKSNNINSNWKDIISKYIEKQLTDNCLFSSWPQYINYIESKCYLGIISKEKRDILIASAYEKLADHVIDERKPNTIYMGLDENYKDALKLVEPLKQKYSAIYQRLWDKLRKQQLFLANSMKFLPPIKWKIPPEEQELANNIIKARKLNSFKDVLQMFLDIPFINEKSINSGLMRILGKGYSIFDEFGFSRQSIEGNTLGRESPEDSKIQMFHTYYRFKIEYLLSVTINYYFRSYIAIDRNAIANELCSLKSDYIDSERIALITEGLYLGFEGSFVVAVHLLIPQLEHLLHDVVEKALGLDLTKLTQERQTEQTLEHILDHLRPMNETIMRELSFFLCHGSDENFRNELCHGLMNLSAMYKHSHYAWWICLWLFFNIDSIVTQYQTRK